MEGPARGISVAYLGMLLSCCAFICECREKCAFFGTHRDHVYLDNDPLYIDIGRHDVLEDFRVDMTVKAAPYYHDGNLLAIGNKREFPYYEFEAVGVQYLVLEIVYSSVTLTLKALGTYFSSSIEVNWANPNTYDIGDGVWHNISAWRSPCCWHLKVDDMKDTRVDLNIGERKTENGPLISNHVYMQDGYAFIGGRPGYTTFQFMGVIKNVRINNRPLRLHSRPSRKFRTNGDVTIDTCDSDYAVDFDKDLFTYEEEEAEDPSWYEDGINDKNDKGEDGDSSMDAWNEHYDYEQRKQPNTHVNHPYPGIGKR